MVTTRRMAKQAAENGGASPQSQKFDGVCVVFTGIDKKLQKTLTQTVSRFGGIVQKSITKITTHLIAHKMTDPKCLEASKNHIPIMKADWITAVKDAPEDVDVKSSDFISTYSCKTFENVLVCVSKCPKQLQDKIENAIVAGGGEYSRNLQKNKTDVVIIPAAIGDKFKVARQWKIPTVTPAWVLNSATEGHLLPLTTFQPRLQPALTSTQIPGVSVHGPTFSGISTIVQPAYSAAIMDSTYMSAQYRSPTVLAEVTTQDETSIQMRTMEISRILFVGICFFVQLESESESRRISKLIQANGGEIFLDAGQVKAGTIAILPPVHSASLPNGILESSTKYWVEDVCQQKCLIEFDSSLHYRVFQVDENSRRFLSGFSVFIAGYSQAIKDYLGVLATHLGANIQKSLNVKSKPGRQRINYVISNDINDKSVDIARNSGIPIVTKDWLVASCEKNALLDHENFLLWSENDSVDEISATSLGTPEGSRKKRKSSALGDASSWVNYSKFGTIIPETPESLSLFSPVQIRDYKNHGDSGTCHHSSTSPGQYDTSGNQHGSQANRLKKRRKATSSSGTSAATSGYTSGKSADRIS